MEPGAQLDVARVDGDGNAVQNFQDLASSSRQQDMLRSMKTPA
jgi:hypothetical protein